MTFRPISQYVPGQMQHSLANPLADCLERIEQVDPSPAYVGAVLRRAMMLREWSGVRQQLTLSAAAEGLDDTTVERLRAVEGL